MIKRYDPELDNDGYDWHCRKLVEKKNGKLCKWEDVEKELDQLYLLIKQLSMVCLNSNERVNDDKKTNRHRGQP
jgi:hypothetical protein